MGLPAPQMAKKPSPIQQRNYDRLTAMAQKGPLSQTNQRNLDYATKRLGLNSQPQMPKVPVDSATTQPTGNFQGDTSVPNLNTIGAPAPMAPAGGGFNTPTGQFNASTAPPLPPGAVYKKGGKVKAKKMASGGMTSKASSASKRADGIAQRGKTKCKMY